MIKKKIVLLSILMLGIGVAAGYVLWSKAITLTGIVTIAKEPKDISYSIFDSHVKYHLTKVR